MFDKVYGYVKKWVTELCHILELIAAIFVFIGGDRADRADPTCG